MAQLNKQDCQPGWPAYFLVAKAGIAEDSWTPNANGLIDLDDEACRDAHDHISLQRASKPAKEQRLGRAARHRDGVVLNISDKSATPDDDESEEDDDWVMPHIDRLRVVLVAADSVYVGEPQE